MIERQRHLLDFAISSLTRRRWKNIALVLTSTGRGSDIMIPMAIPTFGGMSLEIVTMLVVPVLYCAVEELRLKRNIRVSSVSDTLKTP